MFSDQFQTKPDEKGQYFIDRDPVLFHYIIKYLRNPSNGPDWSKLKKKDLLLDFNDEIEYYQIHSLREMIALRLKPLEIIEFASNYNIYESTRDKKGTVIISRPMDNEETKGILFSKCSRWRIKLLTTCAAEMKVGVISSDQFNAETTSWDNGWYVCNNGRLWSGMEEGELEPWGNDGEWGKKGDVIDFEYKNATLSVSVNGKGYGFVYTDLPESLLVGVELCDYGDENRKRKGEIKFTFTKLA
jgi:hypothetical protein